MAFSTSRGGFHILQQPPQTTLLKKYTNLAPQAFPSGTLNYGAAVYIDDDGSLNLAKADVWQNAQTVGVVQGGYTASGMWTVEVVYQGEIIFPNGATSGLLGFPLITGNTYYLSTGLSGGLTTGVPSTSTVVQPMMVATDSYAGVIVNGLPAASVLLGNTQVSIFSPVGTITPFAGTPDKIPGNYLLCVGDSFAKGTTSTDPYNDLYNAIGEKYSVFGLALNGTTGNTGYIRFDGEVDDSYLIASGSPGSTKNHSLQNNQIYKLMWGSKEAVVKVYSATGSTTDVSFQFLKGVTGWATGASSFNDLIEGTEITLKSLKPSEVSGYTSDNFFVPDLRGRTILGAGKGRGLTLHTLGQMGGEESHMLTLDEIPSHNHEIPIRSSVAGGYTPPSPPQQQTIGSGVTASGVNSVSTNQFQANKATTSVTGSSQAHENLQPYLSTNWIIRYKSNKGNPGVEVGPQGTPGIQGATGTPGVTGTTGITGYSLGVLSYRFAENTTPPSGYFYYDTTARNLYFNAYDNSTQDLSPFFNSWDYSTSAIRGTLYIRDAVTLKEIRILGVTQPHVKIGNVYRWSATVDLGGTLPLTTPRLYNIAWIPTGNRGNPGLSITGSPGDRGATGPTGAAGATGATGECPCDLSSWGDSNYKTVYLAPTGKLDGGAGSDGSVFPINLSDNPSEPSAFTYWYNNPSTNRLSSYKRTQPINLSRILYSNWGKNVSLKESCGGGCTSSNYSSVSHLSSAAAAQSLEKSKGVQIVLDRGSYTISRPLYAENGNYHICAGSGNYLEVDPLTLSASSTGSTLTVELTSTVDNIDVGDYLSLTPETFVNGPSGFTGSDNIMGSLSLCGLYTVSGVDSTNGKVTATSVFSNGASGASGFNGTITTNNLGYYRVYKTSLILDTTTGIIVEPNATLTLGNIRTETGLGITGDPFIIVYTGGSSDPSTKAIVCDGGKVNLERGMAIYGTPINGSAIYANGGRVVADRVVASRNGTAVYAENSSVTLKGSVITQNASGIVANKNSVVNIVAAGTTYDYSILANNRTAALVMGANLEIEDKNFHLLVAARQQGILASNNSVVSIVPSSTGSYASVMDAYSLTSGSMVTDPQPVLLSINNSEYQILSNRVNGTVCLTGANGTIQSLTGSVYGFTGNSISYYNQDLVV